MCQEKDFISRTGSWLLVVPTKGLSMSQAMLGEGSSALLVRSLKLYLLVPLLQLNMQNGIEWNRAEQTCGSTVSAKCAGRSVRSTCNQTHTKMWHVSVIIRGSQKVPSYRLERSPAPPAPPTQGLPSQAQPLQTTMQINRSSGNAKCASCPANTGLITIRDMTFKRLAQLFGNTQ